MARRGKSAADSSQSAWLLRRRKRKAGLSEKGAIEILEEAFFLLRQTPLSDLALYYLGAVPFVIGLLYFWGDMSRSAFAESRLAAASLGLAVLFIWMKTWQSVFCRHLTARLHVKQAPALGLKGFWRIAAAQSLLQSTGFLVLPLSAIPMIPLPWVIAFYQSLTVLGDGDGEGQRALRRQAWEQARRWPGQNNWALAILMLFGLFVTINIVYAMVQGPLLLKMLLGIETTVSRSGAYILNSTFAVVLFAVVYLLVDPVFKAVYTLRCFYGASVSSGLDLKVELSSFKAGKGLAAVILAAMMLSLSPGFALAAQPAETPAGQTVSPPELSQNIRDVLEQREYTWRLPREKKDIIEEEPPEKPNRFLKKIQEWYDRFDKWLRSRQPKPTQSDQSTGGSIDWRPATRAVLYVALFVIAIILGIFIYRYLRGYHSTNVVKATGINIEPVDLEDENLTADQKTGDEWLHMARDLIRQGDYRLALRALYLANLAGLADREMIAITRYKTNRDYLTELARRTPNDPDIRDTFAQNVDLFDRVWYGRYMPDQEDVETFARRQDHLLAKVTEHFGPPVIPSIGEERRV